MRLKMISKVYVLAMFAFSLVFFGNAEASVKHQNFGNVLEELNVLKMGPLDPREADDANASLPDDDTSQDDTE
jgi:hypothetical protein